jgi:hypothetical protein
MFAQIEKKVSGNVSVVMSTSFAGSGSAGPVNWQKTKTITSSMHLQSSKGSRDALAVSHLDAKDTTDTPDNNSIMYAPCYLRCSYSNPRTGNAEYALSPFLGRADRINTDRTNVTTNQKMRGGIAG